jgi:hypothetical protein
MSADKFSMLRGGGSFFPVWLDQDAQSRPTTVVQSREFTGPQLARYAVMGAHCRANREEGHSEAIRAMYFECTDMPQWVAVLIMNWVREHAVIRTDPHVACWRDAPVTKEQA